MFRQLTHRSPHLKTFFTPIFYPTTRNYHYLPPLPKNEPIPWKYATIPGDKKRGIPDLRVASFLRGKAFFPPLPILMIPGLTGTHKTFDSIVREMMYPYGVITYDLRGRGDSGSSDQNGLKYHIQDYIRVVSFFRQQSVFVVGHEYGATIALNVAKEFPDRISGITILNSGFTRISRSDGLDTVKVDKVVKGEFLKEMEVTDKEFDSVEQYMQYFGVNPEETTLDQREKYKYELKLLPNGKYGVKADKKAVAQDIEDMDKWNLCLEALWTVRHPINIVRSQYGHQPKQTNHLCTEKRVKELDTILSLRKKITIKDSTYRSLTEKKQNAITIAEAVDYLSEEYDLHRQAEKIMESIRNAEEQEQIDKIYYPNKIRERPDT